MRRLALLGTIAGILNVACGSSTDSTSPPDANAVGSFQLTFTERTIEWERVENWTVSGRLDIEEAGQGYRAVFSAGVSEPFEVRQDGFTLMLTAEPEETRGDHFTEIRIELGADGRPSGPVTADGFLYWSPSGTFHNYPFTAVGTFGPDQVAPVVLPIYPMSRLSLAVQDPMEILPWTSIRPYASEPIQPEVWQSAFEIHQGGQPLQIALTFDVDSEVSWVGSHAALGTVVDWLPLAQGDLVEARVDGVTDPSGNVSGSLSTSFQVVALGSAANPFNMDALPEMHWGDVTAVAASADTSGCESEGCVVFASDGCENPLGGVAGLLSAAAATEVAVRYRLAALAPDDYDQTLPADMPRACQFQLAVPGAAAEPVTAVDVVPDRAILAEAASLVQGLQYVSDWQTLTVPIPSGAPDTLGFAVEFSRDIECAHYEEPGGRQLDLAVLVDVVEAR